MAASRNLQDVSGAARHAPALVRPNCRHSNAQPKLCSDNRELRRPGADQLVLRMSEASSATTSVKLRGRASRPALPGVRAIADMRSLCTMTHARPGTRLIGYQCLKSLLQA